jgi:hypothetical protein
MLAQKLDFFLERQINKHIPLTSRQQKELYQDVAVFLRDQQKLLPSLIPFVEELELTPHKLPQELKVLQEIYYQLASSISRIISKRLSELDKNQQKEFFSRLDKENNRLKKMNPETQLKRLVKLFQFMLGELSPEQKELLTQLNTSLAHQHQLRLQRRLTLQQELHHIYSSSSSSQNLEERFNKAFEVYQKDSSQNTLMPMVLESILGKVSNLQKKKFDERKKQVREFLDHFLKARF